VYYVSREGSRIYLIYNLEANKVICTSSVKFACDLLCKIPNVTNSALSTLTLSSTKYLRATLLGLQINCALLTLPNLPKLSLQVLQTRSKNKEALLHKLQLPAIGKGPKFNSF
jgi:hypothetical protein